VTVEVAVSAAVENVRDRRGILDLGSLRWLRGVLTTSPGASSVDTSGDSLCWWWTRRWR